MTHTHLELELRYLGGLRYAAQVATSLAPSLPSRQKDGWRLLLRALELQRDVVRTAFRCYGSCQRSKEPAWKSDFCRLSLHARNLFNSIYGAHIPSARSLLAIMPSPSPIQYSTRASFVDFCWVYHLHTLTFGTTSSISYCRAVALPPMVGR